MLRGKKGKENKEKSKVELEKGINILIITDGAPCEYRGVRGGYNCASDVTFIRCTSGGRGEDTQSRPQ